MAVFFSDLQIIFLFFLQKNNLEKALNPFSSRLEE